MSAFALAACGSNTPTIPPELLASGGCEAPDYPRGPYGTEEGDILANVCFQGLKNPRAAGYDTSALETLGFSDYFDPDGRHGIALLLIDTSAVWCSACRSEHEGLSRRNDEYGPRGLRIFSTLFQDAQRDPAKNQDLRAWVKNFSSNYAMALDPDYQLGAYASADTAPLNMVVDARTMKIQKKLLGDQESVLWPFIDDALSR